MGHVADLLRDRTYADGGAGEAQALYANRGFIQFAGFTFGLASSFFDFFSSPIVSYFA